MWDSDGYPIAQSNSVSDVISVNCWYDCQTCGPDLGTCLSCGYNPIL